MQNFDKDEASRILLKRCWPKLKKVLTKEICKTLISALQVNHIVHNNRDTFTEDELNAIEQRTLEIWEQLENLGGSYPDDFEDISSVAFGDLMEKLLLCAKSSIYNKCRLKFRQESFRFSESLAEEILDDKLDEIFEKYTTGNPDIKNVVNYVIRAVENEIKKAPGMDSFEEHTKAHSDSATRARRPPAMPEHETETSHNTVTNEKVFEYLVHAIAALDEDKRSLLEAFYLEKKSYREIVSESGDAIKTLVQELSKQEKQLIKKCFAGSSSAVERAIIEGCFLADKTSAVVLKTLYPDVDFNLIDDYKKMWNKLKKKSDTYQESDLPKLYPGFDFDACNKASEIKNDFQRCKGELEKKKTSFIKEALKDNEDKKHLDKLEARYRQRNSRTIKELMSSFYTAYLKASNESEEDKTIIELCFTKIEENGNFRFRTPTEIMEEFYPEQESLTKEQQENLSKYIKAKKEEIRKRFIELFRYFNKH